MSWLDESLDVLPSRRSSVPARASSSRAPTTTNTFLSRLQSAEPDDDGDVPMDLGVNEQFEFSWQREERGGGGEESQLQLLIRYWMNERHSPDILGCQEDVLGRLLDHIRRQSETVQLLRGDPDSSEEEHFRIMLAQTEIERVKFVVRSYVRTRLFKIEKYARYIVATPEIQDRLSQAELTHAQKFAHLVESHFNKSVLQGLPPEQRSLHDQTAFMPKMITEPDKTRAVFAHAREHCPPVRLPDGTALEMEKGRISLVPYHVIEHLLARGSVELV